MSVVPFPENVWRIEPAGEELRVRLVRLFMGKERVLRTLTAASASELPKALGRTSNRAFLDLGREQGVVRQLQLPIDVQRDLKSALALQIEAISAWPEQEVYWDYIVEKSADAKILKITVVVIPKAVLDPWIQAFNSSRIPLAGASLAGFKVNVLPPRLRRGSARIQVAAAYALTACLLLLAAAFFVREPYQQRVYASEINSEISHIEPQVKTLLRQEASLDVLTKRYDLLLGRLNNRDANLEALNTLAGVLPPDTFLSSYRYQNETVTVSGVSASALSVQGALEKTPVFRDVQFTAPITRDASGKDRFTLSMAIEARP